MPTSLFAQYGGCSEYGPFAIKDYLTNKCKCMSGFIFDEDMMGNLSCTPAMNVCHNKYGYNSRYNSLNNSCECSYGYTFGKDYIGKTQCISYDSLCTDKLGYQSRYNSTNDTCECDSGYIVAAGKCESANTVCHSKNGSYSSYNNSSKSCECDSGYTLDSVNQCVKKQNNVYFTLKELDTDNKKAVIRSDYDYSYYVIGYNSGCYSSSFIRYLNKQIVINLGTDYDLDTWDKIVLQDDDETCDITTKEKGNFSSTLIKEKEPIYTDDLQPVSNYSYIPKEDKSFTKPESNLKKEVITGKNFPIIISTSTKESETTSTPIQVNKDKTLIEKVIIFFKSFWVFM